MADSESCEMCKIALENQCEQYEAWRRESKLSADERPPTVFKNGFYYCRASMHDKDNSLGNCEPIKVLNMFTKFLFPSEER